MVLYCINRFDVITLLSAKEVKDTENREEYDSALKILETAINDSVDRRVEERIRELDNYKGAYKHLIRNLEHFIETYKKLVDDFNVEGDLYSDKIESEGGLRALKIIHSEAKYMEDIYFKNKEN